MKNQLAGWTKVTAEKAMSEQTIEKISVSINKMENQLVGWSKVTAEKAMEILGDELSLTETAMDCAERVFYNA